jgi:predicted MFS family arabinose efflux permease
MSLTFRVYQSIFNNFAVEELGVQATQMGLIQSVREVPGLLGFLAGILSLFILEMRIAGLSVILLGAGIFLTGMVQNMTGLIGATLLMSVGFHFFTSGNSSALLLMVGKEEAPKMLGRLNSYRALATLIGSALIFLTLERLGYRTIFQIIGAVAFIGGVVLLPFGKQEVRAERKERRLKLRRDYWLYYVLHFLGGSRRHIFTTFATFLLVREYQVTPQLITLLFLINSLIGTYLHQAFGKIVAQYGERRVMTVNFSLLILVFLGYALVPLIKSLAEPTFLVPEVVLGEWVLFPTLSATPGLVTLLLLFIIDQILFGFSIALQSYFQKIALSPEDITTNISVGQTINHLVAVIVPLAGGLVWEAVGPQYTFFVGVLVAILSLWLTQYMRAPSLAADMQSERATV